MHTNLHLPCNLWARQSFSDQSSICNCKPEVARCCQLVSRPVCPCVPLKNCLFRFRLDLMVVLNRKLLVTLNMMHHPFEILLVKKYIKQDKNQPQKHIHQSHRGFSASYCGLHCGECLKDNIFSIKAKSLLSKVEPLVWPSVSLTRAAGIRGSSQSHSRRRLPSISLMSLCLCVQRTGSSPELKDSEKDVCRN